MRLISMLLIAAGLTASAPKPAEVKFKVTAQLPEEVASIYLDITCALIGGDCPAVPMVLAVPTEEGLLGFHLRGTSVVFITDRCMNQLDATMCGGILVHEMVHYVVSERGTFRDSCVNEEYAWATYNKYVLALGRLDLYVSNWKKGYEKCE